jgi:hypothetical protein
MSGHNRAADVLYKAAWAQVLPRPAASSPRCVLARCSYARTRQLCALHTRRRRGMTLHGAHPGRRTTAITSWIFRFAPQGS